MMTQTCDNTDRRRCALSACVGGAVGCAGSVAILLWSHLLSPDLGAYLEELTSLPCRMILMPLLMAADDSVPAIVTIVSSAGLWTVLGGVIGAWVCRRRADAFRLGRAVVIVVASAVGVLIISFAVAAVTALNGMITDVPGIARVAASSGVRFPVSARLRHSASYWGLMEGETYAVVTMDKSDSASFISSLRSKGMSSDVSYPMMLASTGSRPSWWRPDASGKSVAVDMNSVRVLVDLDDPRTVTVFIWSIL